MRRVIATRDKIAEDVVVSRRDVNVAHAEDLPYCSTTFPQSSGQNITKLGTTSREFAGQTGVILVLESTSVPLALRLDRMMRICCRVFLTCGAAA